MLALFIARAEYGLLGEVLRHVASGPPYLGFFDVNPEGSATCRRSPSSLDEVEGHEYVYQDVEVTRALFCKFLNLKELRPVLVFCEYRPEFYPIIVNLSRIDGR